MQSIKLTYQKGEEIKFVSHLDHMRILERAVRRAGLPIKYSEGYNPRPKISYKTRALKVGETSDLCEAEMILTTWLNTQKVKDLLNLHLPAGFAIISAEI